MEPITFLKCKECNNLATKIGGKQFHHCLQHLTNDHKNEIAALLVKEVDLECSVIDGRKSQKDCNPDSSDSTSSPFTALSNNPGKGANLRGSIFIAIDFSSADFERVDFSFSYFIRCDLRRARLFNSSLRWTCFNRTLLRQADINSSDCRWMQAQSTEENKLWRFDRLFEHIAEKYETAASKYLHVIGRADAECFFRRFGYEPSPSEKKLFEKQEFGDLAKHAKKALNSSGSPAYEQERYLNDVLQDVQIANGELVPRETDWSGAALRDSDLAYSCFDHTLAVEVVFDGSDLYEASFCEAKLKRSSFLNASFSRCKLSDSDSSSANDEKVAGSRFKKANMEGCIFDGTNLERLFFEDATLNNATLKGALLNKAMFFDCKMRNVTADDVVGEKAWFLACDLSGASFKGSLLNKARFWCDSFKNLPIILREEDIKRIQNKWQNWKDDKRRTDLTATNFQASELRSVIFENAKLYGALLQAADLKDAIFKDTKCLGAQFVATNIDGVGFEKANLTSCSFRDAGTLGNPPSFIGATLIDTIFSGMDLSKTMFIDSILDGIDFSGCSLCGAEIRTSSLEKEISMRRASLRNADITGMQFYNVNLSSTDLSFSVTKDDDHSEVTFLNCNLSLASLRRVDLSNISWKKSDLRKADFSYANLRQTVFENCHLEDSSFRGVNCDNAEIRQPQDLDGSDWSDSTLQKCSIFGSKQEASKAENIKFFKAIQFNNASINDFQLKNLFLNTISFQFSELISVKCNNVVFLNADFTSSKLEIETECKEGVHFFQSNFSNAALSKFKGIEYNSVFLECNLDNARLDVDPKSIIFVDCAFRSVSFLAASEKIKLWQKAIFVHCTFRRLKYYGLREAGEELGIRQKYDDDCPKFESVIAEFQKTAAKNTEHLTKARSLADRFPSIAQRLKLLIPEKSALLRDKGYSFIRTLCREFRKDFFDQGLTELASTAYIKEMDCELQLHALRNNLHKSCKFLLDFVLEYKQIGYACISFLLIVIAYFLNVTTSFLSIALLLILVLPLFLLKRGIRLFFAKWLYNYGESVGRMLLSASVCILFFAILYYGFLPKNIDGNMEVCSNINASKQESANECLKLDQSLLHPVFNEKTKIITGCLGQDKQILTRDDCWEAFFTCLYFSGVTFTTLGYGDIKPLGLVRYIAMVEAGLGAFLMALFVFSFTRRNALR